MPKSRAKDAARLLHTPACARLVRPGSEIPGTIASDGNGIRWAYVLHTRSDAGLTGGASTQYARDVSTSDDVGNEKVSDESWNTWALEERQQDRADLLHWHQT